MRAPNEKAPPDSRAKKAHEQQKDSTERPAAVTSWMKFYTGDFSRDTAGLSCAATGAYVRLLVACWVQGSLPKEAASLARIVGADAAQWRKVWPEIKRLFLVDSKRIRSEWVERRFAEQHAKQEMARIAANARWSRQKSQEHIKDE